MKSGLLKFVVACVFLSSVAQTFADEGEYLPAKEKFKACENAAGAGIFWVDSTSGKTWWADPAGMKWVYVGQPKGAKAGPIGTYVPFKNKSGEGVFVLNTATGEGWWTDGIKTWKSLGKPKQGKDR